MTNLVNEPVKDWSNSNFELAEWIFYLIHNDLNEKVIFIYVWKILKKKKEIEGKTEALCLLINH